MNAEKLAQDRLRITEEKDLVTRAKETIPQSTKLKTKQCGRSAYTKDGCIGESVRIILLLICL